MKLTWFGGAALRVYLGGQIVVVSPETASDAVDRGELLAGADRIVAAGEALPQADAAAWRAKPMPRLMDEIPAVEVARIGSALLIAAAGESPLVVLGSGALPASGRWAEGAVIVLTDVGEAAMASATSLLDGARPRLIALAADEEALDRAVGALAARLDGTGLIALEPGLAVEV